MVEATRMPDLYRLLKVKRTATSDEVKASFRKLAMKFHPDRGGDAVKFAAVRDAYEVLGDADRRARYDATGETDRPMDRTAAKLMEVLSPVLIMAMQEAGKNGVKPTEDDLVARMKLMLAANRDRLKEDVKQIALCKANLEAMLGRFKVENADATIDGGNLFEAAIKIHLSGADGQLTGARAMLEVVEKAIEYLGKAKYRADAKAKRESIFGMWTNVSTSAGTW